MPPDSIDLIQEPSRGDILSDVFPAADGGGGVTAALDNSVDDPHMRMLTDDNADDTYGPAKSVQPQADLTPLSR